MGIYERLFGGGTEAETEDAFMGFTAETAAQEAEKLAVDVPEISGKDVGNVALDFTPIIGDIKGGYETVQMIGEELDKENPNYYLIGAMGGLGAVGTILGLVPGAGDVAQKALMSGARMAADRANKIIDAMPEYDPNTVGSMGGNIFAGKKATVEDLDPVRQTGSSKGFYKNKAPNYVPDIKPQTTDQGILIPERPVTIDELQAENAELIPLVADRTAAGQTLTGITGGARDYTFTNPVDLQGGRGFMRYPDTGAFASIERVMGAQSERAADIAKRGKKPKGIHMSMSPEGGDFSVMMSDTVMEMMAQSDISSTDINKLDNWVRENIDRDFPGMRDPSAKDYLATQIPGTRRQLIWKELDKEPYVKAGFPTMGDARVAITDPRLLTTPNLQGTSVANFDDRGVLITGPVRNNKSYNSQVGPTGEAGYRGELEAVPYEILMRQFFEDRRAAGTKSGSDQRSLQMSAVTSKVDDQMVEEVNQYLSFMDQAERDAYVRNLPEQRQERQTYKFGDNGGPPLNDPPVETQMTVAFAEPLEIGINPAAAEGAFLKPYTNEDVQMLEQLAEGATAGTRKADALINSPVEAGTKVGIRLNLNSNIPDAPQGMNKLQTLHKNNYNGTALSYLPTATVENVKFNVSQSGRAGIAAKKYAPDTPEAKNKFPAMSVDGNYVPDRNILNEMDDTVVQIGTNPMNLHLFVDMATGQAVESAEIATVIGDRAFAKGVTYMKQADAPKPKDASDGTALPSDVRYKFNQGGFATAVGY